jgi:hypothetical protein
MLVFEENLPGAFFQYPKFDHLVVNHVCLVCIFKFKW